MFFRLGPNKPFHSQGNQAFSAAFRFRASANFSLVHVRRGTKKKKKKTTAVSSRKQRANSYSMGMEWKPKKLLLHAEQTSVSMPRVRAAVSALPFRRCLPACRVAEKLRGGDMAPRRHGPPDAPGLSACRVTPAVPIRTLRSSAASGIHPGSGASGRVTRFPVARALTSARLREMTEQRSAGRKRLRRTGNTTFGWTGKRHFEFSTTRQRLQIYTWSDSDPRPPVMHRRVVWIQGSALVGNRFVFLTSASRPSIATDGICLAGCFGREPSQQDG